MVRDSPVGPDFLCFQTRGAHRADTADKLLTFALQSCKDARSRLHRGRTDGFLMHRLHQATWSDPVIWVRSGGSPTHRKPKKEETRDAPLFVPNFLHRGRLG